MLMLVEFVIWWYSTGWLETLQRIGGRVKAVWRMFSVAILLRTLFSPWRRIISPPGKSIEEIFRGILDNTVSRFVGFFVRGFALFAAFLLTGVAVIVGGIIIVAWPLLPFAAVFFLLKGTIL